MSLRVPDPYNGPTTSGVDVSFYQKRIDWPKLAAAHEHVRFAIARSGDGLGNDSTFERNYKGARDAGLVVGAYEFVRPLLDVDAQAKLVVAKLRAVGFRAGVDLPPTIDVERGDDPTLGHERVVHHPERVGDEMLRWLDVVEAELGVRPMCYGGAFFAEAIHDARVAKRAPLWTPMYGAPNARIPRSWADQGLHWTIWQYDSSHGIDGVAGMIDHDLFRGDEQALRAFCASSKV